MLRPALQVLLLVLTAAPVAAQPAAEGKRYAVVVGVNKYEHPNLTELKYAVADAAALGAVLKGAGYDTTLLTDDTEKKPTKENVDAALKAVLPKCKKGDTVVLAFAGHGLQFGGVKDAFFCPQDARPSLNGKASLVSLSQLYADLDDSFAGVKVILVDACRNDPDPNRGRGRGIDADTAPAPPKGVAALYSCSAGERAWEHESLKHGVFFHYVLEGLAGKAANARGQVTFNTLTDYVSTHVSEQVPKLVSGVKQSPNQKADLSGSAPVLVTVQAPAKGPDAGGATTTALAEALKLGKTDLEKGLNLYYGRGTKADIPKAATHFRAAAEAGNPEGMLYLAVACHRGLLPGGERDAFFDRLKFALHWLEKAAALDHDLARYYLGAYHGDINRSTERKLTAKACEALCVATAPAVERAAKDGHPLAMYLRGRAADPWLTPDKGDVREAVGWLLKAAEAGEAAAMQALVRACRNKVGGDDAWEKYGVKRDDNERFKWTLKLATAGELGAMWSLGDMYQRGEGTAKDREKALGWYRRTADAGDARAAHDVAEMLSEMLTQELLDREDEAERKRLGAESVRYLKMAAEGGSYAAMYTMGSWYETGSSYQLPKDRGRAVEWYRKAAKDPGLESCTKKQAEMALKRLGAQP